MSVGVEGPHLGLVLRTTVESPEGRAQTVRLSRFTRSTLSRTLRAAELGGGSRYVGLQLLGEGGKVLDRRRQYLRLPEPGKRTCLNLITFYTPRMLEAAPEKMRLLR